MLIYTSYQQAVLLLYLYTFIKYLIIFSPLYKNTVSFKLVQNTIKSEFYRINLRRKNVMQDSVKAM